ncbi:hypothetical protein BMETH_1534_0 [methanotrophic bacterial endosymbiont of Bathymodiolus sp.]|nr:hypothetical protein BMETH_1534_0 [methanotrophic bacterial endosymbiont of Bathymodiolus sp.]
MAAQTFFKGYFLSKVCALSEFIVYLPASTELGVQVVEKPKKSP